MAWARRPPGWTRGLARIAALNPPFRAFTTVDAEGARRAPPRLMPPSRDGRWLGLLHGMTVRSKTTST